MMFTRSGEQYDAERDPDCISRMKRSRSMKLQIGCTHVNQEDISLETRSSSSIMEVQGRAGTGKRGASEDFLASRIWR